MLPPDTCFAWLYKTSPVFGISTIIELDLLRLPSQVLGPGVGRKASHFAYPVLSIHRLSCLLSSSELVSAHSIPIPHRWCPAPSSLPHTFADLLPL